MQNSKTKFNFAKSASRFFAESSKPRSRSDYTEIFTRGLSRGERSAYPWLWVRVFLLFAAFYAVAVAVYSITDNGVDVPTMTLFGALFVNLSYFVLCYEIYPRRDVSLLSMLAAIVVGGFVSVCIAMLGYRIYDTSAPYLAQLWTATLEEFSKLAATVALILIFRRRDPFYCFLLGLSVGVGFSIAEDMGYAWFGVYSYNHVETAVIRAVGAPFGHPMWAASVGWALGCGKNPLADWKIYACFLSSVALHFLWNLPLGGGAEAAVCVACGAAGTVGTAFILASAYRSATVRIFGFSPFDGSVRPFSDCPPPAAPAAERPRSRRASKFGYAANIAACAAIVLTVALTLVSSYSYSRNSYVTHPVAKYRTVEAFVAEAQCGNDFYADFSRPYDPKLENAAEVNLNGITVFAVQAVGSVPEGHIYLYEYSLVVPEGEEEASGELKLGKVTAAVGEERYEGFVTELPSGEPFGFFAVSPDIIGDSAQFSDDGSVTVQTAERILVLDDVTVSCAAAAGLTLVCGVAAYAAFRILSKEKNHA